jgi:hypothetical protein
MADPIIVKHREGASHGFVVLRSGNGKVLATGDAIQTVTGPRVTSKLVLHFADGSLYEDTTVFEQKAVFRLLSDHVRQQGPSFPDPLDAVVDTAGTVTVSTEKGKDTRHQLKIPNDAANGLLFTIIKNLPTTSSETTVSLVTTESNPRIVKFRIRPSGTNFFTAGGPQRKAMHLVGHTDIPGIAGAVAHVIGKQPADVDFWILEGSAPTLVEFRGPLYDQGPIWSIEPASPKLAGREP